MCFSEALMKERMNRAANLLRTHPAIPLPELAASLGFTDSSYFIRCFSKAYGMGAPRLDFPPEDGGCVRKLRNSLPDNTFRVFTGAAPSQYVSVPDCLIFRAA